MITIHLASIRFEENIKKFNKEFLFKIKILEVSDYGHVDNHIDGRSLFGFSVYRSKEKKCIDLWITFHLFYSALEFDYTKRPRTKGQYKFKLRE